MPDLGKDLIREFWYEKEAGSVACELNVLPSGMSTGRPDGPRYFEFHPRFNVAYVVNELSSTVSLVADFDNISNVLESSLIINPHVYRWLSFV